MSKTTDAKEILDDLSTLGISYIKPTKIDYKFSLNKLKQIGILDYIQSDDLMGYTVSISKELGVKPIYHTMPKNKIHEFLNWLKGELENIQIRI